MKTLYLLISTLFCTIGAKAQPWIGPVAGNIYYNGGNVGIGTTIPVGKLEVKSSATIKVLGANNDLIINTGDVATYGGLAELGFAAVGYPIASITAKYNTWGASYLGGELIFGTKLATDATMQQRMVITNSGNVGIGTSSPLTKLEIVTSSNGLLNVLSVNNNLIGASAQNNGAAITIGQSGSYYTKIATVYEQNNPSYLQPALAFYTMYNSYLAGSEVERMRISSNGNVGIGTTNPTYKLDVIGTIRAKEIKVDLNGADFVFEKDYKLMPINELEAFVKEQKHLPEVAPAKEMQENGTDLGNLNSKLLQKVEELTLYAIEQNKSLIEQAKKIESLEKAVNILISK